MVAMNPQTWAQDLKEIEPGGYVFYDNTKPLPPSKSATTSTSSHAAHRDLQRRLQRPARAPALQEHHLPRRARRAHGPRARAIAELIGEQYKGKEKLLKPNLNALQLA